MADSNAGQAGAEREAPAEAKPSFLSRLIEGFKKTEADKDAVRTRRLFVGFAISGFLTTNFLMFLRFFSPADHLRATHGVPHRDAERFWHRRRHEVSKVTTGLGRQEYRAAVRDQRDLHPPGLHADWKQSEQKFKCPCHGSGYDPEGINYEGPAPRPMDRAWVELRR